MSVTNRAFIKAYAWDRSEPTPPTPHLVFAPAHPKQQPSDSGSGSTQNSEATDQGAGVTTRADQPARLGIPRKQSDVVPPSRSNRPAGVTSFVPAPHISLGGVRSGKSSDRRPLSVGNQPPAENTQPPEQSAEASVPHAEKKTSQPLSSFTEKQPIQEKFEPAFGVPEFGWPQACGWIDQFFKPDYRDLFALIATHRGSTAPVIAITGSTRGEGRSTTLLSVAQQAARLNLRTVMVDADFAQPSLAQQLAIATTTGWEDVLSGEIMLPEAMIYAEREKLSLLPLGEVVQDRHAAASCLHVTISLAILSQHYDLVLVDVGPLGTETSAAGTLLRRAKFTGALLVQDTRQAEAESLLLSTLERLAELHVPALGVIENFSSLKDFAPLTDPQRTNAA